ncbi:MAG: 6-phosphofructokinase [Candidatus Berkelbacteria bacterium]|nr:6-phosphofructokinase [Candidatus Berkelbacteria bacterium]
MNKRIAVLTGGGCAPGLDPAIEGLVNSLSPEYGVIGIVGGWKSIRDGAPVTMDLTDAVVRGWVRNSGTSIKTSRIKPLNEKNLDQIASSYYSLGIDGIVAAGGDDTLGNALFLKQAGFSVIGIPKTMDLDLKDTDYSVGFQSYVESCRQIVNDYIETLKSHSRVGVVEVFGRDSGFTAAELGIVTDACYIGIPEIDIDLQNLRQQVASSFYDQGWALVVVSEAVNLPGERDLKPGDDGHIELKEREAGKLIALMIHELTGLETKSTQLDHPFRGRIISYDAMAGFRLGLKAAEMVRQDQWGEMIAIHGEKMDAVPLENFQGTRRIDPDDYRYELVTGRNSGMF